MRAGLLLLIFDAVPDRGKDISRALDLACAIELAVIDILSLPYDIAAQYGELYVHMLATQRGMVSGVVNELFHASGLQASELYDVVITRKTGRLFSLAAMWGCLAARSGGLGSISGKRRKKVWYARLRAFASWIREYRHQQHS